MNGGGDKQLTVRVIFTLKGLFNTIVGDQNLVFANFFQAQLAKISMVSMDRIQSIAVKSGTSI